MEAHYVEELSFLSFTENTSIAAHCMCYLGGRNIIFVGAGSKLWLLIGEAESCGRARGQISSPTLLSRDLNQFIAQSSDERVLCLWSLPADVCIQHGRESTFEDAHSGGVPLVTVAFGRPFGEHNQPCSLLIFDAHQLISDAQSLRKPELAPESPPLAAALDTLPFQVAPMILRCEG